MTKLRGDIVAIADLSPGVREEMFRLLTSNFCNVRRHVFLRDLEEKEAAVLLTDGIGALQGFSTYQLFPFAFGGKLNRVIFSGDTIISPKHWGSMELPIVWGIEMVRRWEASPDDPLWWMLISKGIRTFKFLPVFFRTYHPHPQHEPPQVVRELMNALGRMKFPDQFDAGAGIVQPVGESYFLRPELAGKQFRSGEYAEYFYVRNPEYRRGAELLCLTEFSPHNLQPLILRMISRRRGAGSTAVETPAWGGRRHAA